MTDTLAGLEPTALWRHFADITRIPRPSGHEERMIEYVRSVAGEHGFDVRSDQRGNLSVMVPARNGESGSRVILQSHLDMVCEKNRDVEHDFMNDPIRPRIDGEWVRATGTTLGADNGIGVAAALAAATDESVRHGPLQLLFTVDEEVGLTGAAQLDGSLLEGETMLNLDSEEDGVLFVGCAGGADSHLIVSAERVPASAGRSFVTIEVSGLRGGHSGLNIHENRGNALKLLTRILLGALADGVDFELASIEGGGKHNAIPREAFATVGVDDAGSAALGQIAERMTDGFRTELQGVDDGLQVKTRPAEHDGPVFAAADRNRLLRLLATVPHGVLAMSREIDGLVETSNNLATVTSCADGRLRIVTSSRSSVASAMDGVLGSIRAAAGLAGAGIEHHNGYPGWQPNMESKVLEVVRGVYREIWETEPEVTAIHAGLECGLLGEKKPGLDMVSFGPLIEGAHSPEERVHVPSVGRFWRALRETLARLA